MNPDHPPGFETLCVHHGEDRRRYEGAAAPPLFQASTFTYPDCESFSRRHEEPATQYDYTRLANPTTAILERKIAALEQGEACRAFASGMAAISAAVLSVVKTGDHIVTVETVYGPTRRLFSEYLPRFGIETTYVRGTELSQFENAVRPNTRLIYLESPSSLLFELQDLAAVGAFARAKNIDTICDNSYATPYLQNPIPLGIDMAVHTATKYIGGHSDLVAGLLVGREDHMRQMWRFEGQLLGGTADPFAAWLMLRGLRTLSIRLERHQKSATQISRFLAGDNRIRRVFYPGLEFHPQAALARKQMRGQSGMLSFQLADDSRERTFAVVDALRWFCIGVSWGGFESLAIPLEVPDPETGRSMWIIRLSIGLESVEDLKVDLYQALG